LNQTNSPERRNKSVSAEGVWESVSDGFPVSHPERRDENSRKADAVKNEGGNAYLDHCRKGEKWNLDKIDLLKD
jgi:hypothetical protein